jgi:hypothetical protein
MGQYFHPIVLDAEGKIVVWMNAHMYNNGLKLMEHSFLGNNFVCTFEYGLGPDGAHYKSRVVWAGDYAAAEPGAETNLHQQCTEYSLITPKEKITSQYRYVVNHTKRQFVDKTKIPSKDGYTLHPLPLLTAEGHTNAEYRGRSRLLGTWSRNVLSVERLPPSDYDEIQFDLVEE